MLRDLVSCMALCNNVTPVAQGLDKEKVIEDFGFVDVEADLRKSNLDWQPKI